MIGTWWHSAYFVHSTRQEFRIIEVKNEVKGIIRHCVICVGQRATVVHQLMGSLTDSCTMNYRPFPHFGVEYAGAFQIRFAPGRFFA